MITGTHKIPGHFKVAIYRVHNIRTFLSENLKEKEHLRDLVVEGCDNKKMLFLSYYYPNYDFTTTFILRVYNLYLIAIIMSYEM
jgi:hypothetical protein